MRGTKLNGEWKIMQDWLTDKFGSIEKRLDIIQVENQKDRELIANNKESIALVCQELKTHKTNEHSLLAGLLLIFSTVGSAISIFVLKFLGYK